MIFGKKKKSGVIFEAFSMFVLRAFMAFRAITALWSAFLKRKGPSLSAFRPFQDPRKCGKVRKSSLNVLLMLQR